jgi:hypothetical protein
MQGPINIRAVKPDAYLIHRGNSFPSAFDDNGGCQFKLKGEQTSRQAVEAVTGVRSSNQPAGRSELLDI